LWFKQKSEVDGLIKAAIAHLWFVTLHPFDDGNGRITRAITDMMLAQVEQAPQRFYSMSTQIRKQRKSYYDILEKTQKGTLDITDWLRWFLDCLRKAMIQSDETLAFILNKTEFWRKHSGTSFNQRQITMLNRLFDGFVGKLTSGKWAKMMKCSQDTAARDIKQLMEFNVLVKSADGGRSTSYLLKDYVIRQK
jgi:Fic family protein